MITNSNTFRGQDVTNKTQKESSGNSMHLAICTEIKPTCFPFKKLKRPNKSYLELLVCYFVLRDYYVKFLLIPVSKPLGKTVIERQPIREKIMI